MRGRFQAWPLAVGTVAKWMAVYDRNRIQGFMGNTKINFCVVLVF
jgi:hypothetical protein